jgi:hypothetical protein
MQRLEERLKNKQKKYLKHIEILRKKGTDLIYAADVSDSRERSFVKG